VICVAGHTDDDVGVSSLHGAGRAPQADDSRCPAHWHMIEPARRQPQMLGQADGTVRKQAETGNTKPVDIDRPQSGRPRQIAQGAGDPPVRAFYRMTLVWDRHRRGNDHIVVAFSRAD